jgi:hypothetical protein
LFHARNYEAPSENEEQTLFLIVKCDHIFVCFEIKAFNSRATRNADDSFLPEVFFFSPQDKSEKLWLTLKIPVSKK